jgi:galactokinase
VHSGIPRSLDSSAYAQRRAACERAAARIGVKTLRDATPERVAGDPIARHVVSENARVTDFVAALRGGDLEAAGRLAIESHESLAVDFEVSTPELDLLVNLAVGCGAYGARLTGAGFGGCIVALVPVEETDKIIDTVVDRYRAQTGLPVLAFPARAVDGAGPLTV